MSASKYSKLVGSLVGAISAPGLVQILDVVGVHIPQNVIEAALPLAIAVLSALGVYAAPKNAGTDQHVTVPVYVQPTPATDERPTVPTPPSAPGTTPPIVTPSA